VKSSFVHFYRATGGALSNQLTVNGRSTASQSAIRIMPDGKVEREKKNTRKKEDGGKDKRVKQVK